MTQHFLVFGDRANSMKKGMIFRVSKIYTIEGGPVAKLETVE